MRVNGMVAHKASMMVDESADVTVQTDAAPLRYASRAGRKLEHAIQCFNLDLTGARVLDIGSSTGGFTDCALQHGAAEVIAVDVGTDCMVPWLAADPRVQLYEQTDIRLAPDECFRDIDLAVCDASFIRLQAVLEPLKRVSYSTQREAPLRVVALIKPQFQVGANIARKCKGVITDPAIHERICQEVVADLEKHGLHTLQLIPSPIKGGDGNTEFLVLLEQPCST